MAATVHDETFAKAWRRGYQVIPVLRLTAGVDLPESVRAPYSLRKPLPGHPVKHVIAKRRRVLGCFIIGFLPLPIAVLLRIAGPHIGIGSWKGFGWTIGLCTAAFIMCVAANAAWTYVDNNSDLVDEVMHSALDQGHLASWLDRAYTNRRQWPVIVVSVVAAASFLSVFHHSIERVVEVPAASYLTVTWVSAIGANSLYWFAVAPHVVRAMSKQSSLLLHWYDPASTPALRMLGKGLIWASAVMLVGSLGIFGVGFVAPEAIKVRAVDVLLLIFFILAIVLLLNSSVVPFCYLVSMAGKTKTESLRRLSRLIKDLHERVPSSGKSPGRYQLDNEQGMLVATYRSVSAASNVPFATAGIVQYGAVVAAGILAPLWGIITAIVKVVTA